jgi:phytoene desaturase
MYTLTERLVEMAEKRGAILHLNSPVEKIMTDKSKVSGVQVNGNTISADVVISNADMHHTEHALLEPDERMYSNRYWKKRSFAPSAVLMYLGVKDTYPALQHHNLVFSKDWRTNFKDLSSKKWPKDPSFYVCNPNKTDSNVAPTDHENLFVMIPVSTRVKYTEEELDEFTEQILTTMEQTLHLKDLRENIVYKKVLAGRDFESEFNAYKGSALGLNHTLKQTAAFRPRNAHSKVHNLYFVGAGTTPGVGLPMCLISAELVYKRVKGDMSAALLKTPVS